MPFQKEDIRIPYKEKEEIPLGMIGLIPVELRRVDGVLEIYTPYVAVEVVDETPEGLAQAFNKLSIWFEHKHPNLVRIPWKKRQ